MRCVVTVTRVTTYDVLDTPSTEDAVDFVLGGCVDPECGRLNGEWEETVAHTVEEEKP